MSKDNSSSSGSGCSPTGGGCGLGCGGFLSTVTVGGVLCAFGASAGLALSVQIPFTDVHITAAGVAGNKAKIQQSLPEYARGHLGALNDPINQSVTMTVGPIEGGGLVLIAEEPKSTPWIDLHFDLH